MTGFGRAEHKSKSCMISCEIRSLNHKGLDIKVRLPRECASFEVDVIEIVRKFLSRGRVELFINVEMEVAGSLLFDDKSADQLVKSLLKFARKHQLKDVSVGDLLQIRELISHEGKQVIDQRDLLTVVEAALQDLQKTRRHEGRHLLGVLQRGVQACEKWASDIQVLTKNAPQNMLGQLKVRVAQLLEKNADEQRFVQELAIIADKVDVTEELNRLESHFQHFAVLCNAQEPQGRKLDFLCQEMFREANTIGSKCTNAKVAHAVVELKAELERVREQVQNIE